MPQELISQFDRRIAMPIETFRQVQTINLRDAIPTNIRWEGMIVYVMSEKLSYVLVGGLSNSQWVDLGTLVNVTVRDNLTSTSTTDALSANQGRVLKNLIDAIPTGGGIWGSITGTLSDQTDLQSALNGKESTISPGTTAQYFRGDKTWQTLNKASVGLGNVDNTSDLDKPISTLTQTALNGKEPSFSKNTGFNKNFGTTAGTVSEGNHTHTFASLTAKPTTIAGYGITDFNSLGDARWLGISAKAADSNLLDGIDSTGFARLGSTTLNTTYLFLNRNGSSGQNTLHVNQEGAGDIAAFRKAAPGVVDNSISVVIDNTGGLIATGNITAPSFKTTNWEIVETGGVLQFKQGGTVRFQMKSTGVIEATNFKLGLV